MPSTQTTTFKGARYVTKFSDPIEWDSTRAYEAIEAVQNNGFTYLSKQPVPAGVQIDNDEFWLLWADPNAQMEQLRELVEQYAQDVENLIDTINNPLEIVSNIAELKESTADYVLVLNNDSTTRDLTINKHPNTYATQVFGKGDACMFWKVDGKTEGGYLREDGSMMFAMPNQGTVAPNAPMTDLCDCVASWVDRPTIVYGKDRTPFMASPYNEMDCSSFSTCAVYGLTYMQSKLFSQHTENTLGNWHSTLMPSMRGASDGHLLYLSTMTEWFAEQKRLFTIDKNAANPLSDCGIAPGDMLFVNAQAYIDHHGPDDEEDYSAYLDEYYNVTHCCMVLQVFADDGKILIAQAGGLPSDGVTILGDYFIGKSVANIHIALVDFETGVNYDAFQIYARPDYGIGNNTVNDITGPSLKLRDTVSAGNVNAIYHVLANNPITPDKCYSFTIEGNPLNDSDDQIMHNIGLVNRESEAQEHVMRINPAYRILTDKYKQTMLIFPPRDYTVYDSVYLRCDNYSVSNIHQVTLNRFSLNRGVEFNANTDYYPDVTFSADETVHDRYFMLTDNGFVSFIVFTPSVTDGTETELLTFGNDVKAFFKTERHYFIGGSYSKIPVYFSIKDNVLYYSYTGTASRIQVPYIIGLFN